MRWRRWFCHAGPDMQRTLLQIVIHYVQVTLLFVSPTDLPVAELQVWRRERSRRGGRCACVVWKIVVRVWERKKHVQQRVLSIRCSTLRSLTQQHRARSPSLRAGSCGSVRARVFVRFFSVDSLFWGPGGGPDQQLSE